MGNPFILQVICFISVFPVLSVSSRAESSKAKGQSWTVERILERAVERSPGFKALERERERAKQWVGQAGRWENPEFSLSFGPMTQSGMSGSSLDFSFKQSLPLFGQKSVAGRIAGHQQASVDLDTGREELRLKHEVVRLAYRLAALEEQSHHVGHSREKVGLILKFLESRPFAAPSQTLEKHLVLNHLREVESRLLDIHSAKEQAWRSLNVYLDLDEPVLPAVDWAVSPALIDRDQWWTLCLKGNPEIQKEESLNLAAELEVDLARTRGLPEIKLGGYFNRETAGQPQRIFAGGLDFTLPILDRATGAVGAASAARDSAAFRLEQKRLELKSEFDRAWVDLVTGKKRIELFPLSLIHDLETQMATAEKNWKKGWIPIMDLLELEDQVHDQAIRVFAAQVTFLEALSQIQYLSGREFNRELR